MPLKESGLKVGYSGRHHMLDDCGHRIADSHRPVDVRDKCSELNSAAFSCQCGIFVLGVLRLFLSFVPFLNHGLGRLRPVWNVSRN